MIKATDVVNWSCTKLRDFFERRTPNWIAENVTLDGVMAMHMKLRQCSPEIARRAIPILKLIKAKIASQK